MPLASEERVTRNTQKLYVVKLYSAWNHTHGWSLAADGAVYERRDELTYLPQDSNTIKH